MGDYNAIEDTACENPGWKNVITSSLGVPREDALYRNKMTGSRGKRAVWTPEHKNVLRMKHLVRKSTTGGVLMMDLYPGTCLTAEASTMPAQPRKFVGCDLD